MEYKEGIPRDQLFLYTECLDQIIGENNTVRVIDAYVKMLDIRRLGFKIPVLKTGRPPYNPIKMLALYIYGYLERIRSSRKLEKECCRNKELIWLMQGLTPDFKTIADFRKDNLKGIKNIFKEFLYFCKKMKLLSLEIVAIDGTKLRAQNSKNNVYKRDEIERIQQKIEGKIAEYLSELDIEDEKEADDLKLKNGDEVSKVVEKLKKMIKYKDKVEDLKKKFNEDDELKTIFFTDPDSRFQSDKGKKNPGYNVQTVVDDEKKLIVVNEVTNQSNDLKQMTPMIEKVNKLKQELKIENDTNAIMDAGYHSEKEIMENKDKEGIHIVVSNPKEAQKHYKKEKKENDKVPVKGFKASDFIYDKDQDAYKCPDGKYLFRRDHKKEYLKDGKKIIEYHCRECDDCPKRNLCTRNMTGRTIQVSVNRQFMDHFNDSMKTDDNKKLLSKRKEIVEHPFGTMKRNLGYSYFMQRGFEKVRTEFSFICFIYNFKRLLNIFSVEQLIQAMK